MKSEKPLISAKTKEGFMEISDALNTLSIQVRGQIEKAYQGTVGISCKFRTQNIQKYYLPVGVTHIADFDNYIGIYCKPFFFIIDIDEDKPRKIEYMFEQPPKKDAENDQ